MASQEERLKVATCVQKAMQEGSEKIKQGRPEEALLIFRTASNALLSPEFRSSELIIAVMIQASRTSDNLHTRPEAQATIYFNAFKQVLAELNSSTSADQREILRIAHKALSSSAMVPGATGKGAHKACDICETAIDRILAQLSPVTSLYGTVTELRAKGGRQANAPAKLGFYRQALCLVVDEYDNEWALKEDQQTLLLRYLCSCCTKRDDSIAPEPPADSRTSTRPPTVLRIPGVNGATRDEAGDVTDEKLCVVCMEAPKDSVLIPCGHVATCVACAENPSMNGRCPLCRTKVMMVQKIYPS